MDASSSDGLTQEINSSHESYMYVFKPTGIPVADGHSVYYHWQWPVCLSIFIGYIANMGCS